MKYALAIILLAIAMPLSAGARCTKANAHRIESAPAPTAKPVGSRAEAVRQRKVVTITAWQRAVLFDPQIL